MYHSDLYDFRKFVAPSGVHCHAGFRDARNGRIASCNEHGMKNFHEFKDYGSESCATTLAASVASRAGFAILSPTHLFPPEIFATTREHLKEKDTRKV